MAMISAQMTALCRRFSTTAALPRKQFGITDLHLSTPGLGGVGIGASEQDSLYGGVSDEVAVETVHAAVARGINWFDTSPLYQESERRLGLALSTLSQSERNGLVVMTKVGDECSPWSNNGGHAAMSRDGVLCSIEHSLQQLQTDALDVVFLHDPTMAELDQFLQPDGGMEALLQLREQGVLKYIGLGCVEREQQLKFMQQSPVADCVLAVNDFNLVRRFATDDLFPVAQQQGVGIINAGIYYMGLLADPHHSWELGFKRELKKPALKSLALQMEAWSEERGIPLKTLALQYGLRHDAVSTSAIGCRSAQEVHEVCDSMLSQIEPSVWHEFDQTFSKAVAELSKHDHWYYDKETSNI